MCDPDFSKLKCELEITSDSFFLSQKTHKHCKRYNTSITFFLFALRTLFFILSYVAFNVWMQYTVWIVKNYWLVVHICFYSPIFLIQVLSGKPITIDNRKNREPSESTVNGIVEFRTSIILPVSECILLQTAFSLARHRARSVRVWLRIDRRRFASANLLRLLNDTAEKSQYGQKDHFRVGFNGKIFLKDRSETRIAVIVIVVEETTAKFASVNCRCNVRIPRTTFLRRF